MCKMIISPGVFSFFQSFDILDYWEGGGGGQQVKGQAMVQNEKNI